MNGRTLAGSFVVGGACGVVGQPLLTGYTALLGEGSSYTMAAVLVTLGVLAFTMYVPGLHQRIQEKSGYGSMLPLTALPAGLPASSRLAEHEHRSQGGLASALMLVGIVMGVGSAAAIAVALVANPM